MAANFLGLPIRVTLKDGRKAEGTLSDINATQGSLTLDQCLVTKPEGRTVQLSAIVLQREAVLNLELLAISPAQQQQKQEQEQKAGTSASSSSQGTSNIQRQVPDTEHLPAPTLAPRDSQRSVSSSSKSNRKQKKHATFAPDSFNNDGSEADQSAALDSAVDETDTGDYSEPQPMPIKSNKSSNRRARRAAKQQHQHQEHEPPPPQQTSLHDEFDFAAGLKSFDKAKVFDEIRNSDTSDPATLLVAHNKRVAAAGANGASHSERYHTKLLPSQNVLDETEKDVEDQDAHSAAMHQRASSHASKKKSSSSASTATTKAPLPAALSNGGAAHAKNVADASETGEEDTENDQAEAQALVHGKKQQQEANGSSTSAGFKTLDGGLYIPPLTAKQFQEVISLANIELGPNLLQRIENGGRGIAQYILQHLASPQRQLFHSSHPSNITVVVLCGVSLKGQYGLRTGAHLVNKGVNAVVWLPPVDSLPANFDFQLRLFLSAGGRVVRAASELPAQPSIIVDALADNEASSSSAKLKRKQARPGEGDVVLYANSNVAPKLAIDMPSFLHPDKGSLTGAYSVQARFSAALGAFRPAHALPRATGEIVLVDVGLPHQAFAQALAEDSEGDGELQWPKGIYGADWLVACKRDQR